MIVAQNLLVIGSLMGLVVLAILWAARFNNVKFEEEEMQHHCTWYTGLNTECADPATELRDGSPHCDFHAGVHDGLVRAEKMQEDCEELELADDEVQDEDGWIHRPSQMPRKGDL